MALLRERGLRPEDVDVVPGASGGPKWLVLAGLDRFLAGDFFHGSSVARTRPLHAIGASIGSWRLACYARKDPLTALSRFGDAYIEQTYPNRKPSPELVSQTSSDIVRAFLGESGAAEVAQHETTRLHVLTTRGRGLLSTDRRGPLLLGLAFSALANAASRRTLAWQASRFVFHAGGDPGPFAGLRDLPTEHEALTQANVADVLLASGSIPGLMSGVPIGSGRHRDGGIVDYHLDLDFGPGPGLVLYPHFYSYVIPGWFDKGLPWRRAGARSFERALILAPSADFVSRLPDRKIPDREDFYRLRDADRIRAWRRVQADSDQLACELQDLIASGRLSERVRPLP